MKNTILVGRHSLTKLDIDADVPSNSRQTIIEYIINKYGREQVACIGTAQNFKLKSTLKDLLKSKGVDFKTANILTSLFDKEYDHASFDKIFEVALAEKKIKDIIEKYPEIIYEIYLLIFQPRSFGIHAAGVVIAPSQDKDGNKTTIHDYLPCRMSDDGQYITEWEKEAVEEAGMLKEDILGLTQLDKIIRINELIKESGNSYKNFNEINLDDAKIMKLFKDGLTEDIFQFNTDIQKNYLLKLQPNGINDLIAANALNRPGAMESDYHNKFIKIKNGEERAIIPPLLEEELAETYGMFCLSGNSNITTKRGYIKLKDIVIGDHVLTEDGSYQKVINKFNNGIKKTVKIKTNLGEELICTPDHKVLTSNGWIEVKKLKRNDLIKSFWVNEECNKLSGTEKDWIVGHYLADGSNTSFATSSEDFAIKLVDIIKRNFPMMENVYFKKRNTSNCHHVHVNNFKGGFGNPNYFKNWLRSLDIIGYESFSKRIPNNILNLEILAGFIEGDGNIKNNTIRIKNEFMAHQLFLIFQSCRIRSFIRKDKLNVDLIGFNDINRELPYKIKQLPPKSTRSRHSVRIPYNLISEESRNYLFKNNDNLTIAAKKQILKSAKKLGFYSKDILDKSKIVVEHDLWARVLDVKDYGYEEVYDISVENNHSYVAGGLVVHNCYQEGAMMAYQKITDCTLEESDNFRKIISKAKKGKVNPDIEKYEEIFKKAYINKIQNEEVVNTVWDEIIALSLYAFNKSHAASYALTGYWAAYYKAYFPVEFYTTSLEFASNSSKSSELLPRIITEIYSSNLVSLNHPDINESGWQYSVDSKKNSIYWSLISIKQAGQKVVETLLEERGKNGKYFSFDEFLIRAKNTKVNKRVIINFILCGCFDDIEEIKEEKDRLRLIEQYSSFLKEDLVSEITQHKNHTQNFYWILLQKQLCGLGMINYQNIFKNIRVEKGWSTTPFCDGISLQDDFKIGKKVVVAGLVENIQERDTKNGKMCNVILNCNDTLIRVTVWPDTYKNYIDIIKNSISQLVFIDGLVKVDSYRNTNVIQTIQQSVFSIQ